MADDAQKDRNFVNSLLAVSSADNTSTVKLWADPTTHRLLVDASGAGASAFEYKVDFTVGTANADYLVGDYADIGAAINAAYAALPTSGGAITVLVGTYSFSTPIVFGTANKFVTLRSVSAASTYLKYTPTSGNAITVNCGNPTGHLTYDICGFTLMGKSSLIAAGQANTNTSVGIYYGGANGAVGVNTHDINVNGFGSNWEIGSNAYMLSFNNFANSGGNGGQAARGALLHINSASNSGERNVFQGGAFTDPGNSDATNAVYITNAGTSSNSFADTSFDNAQIRIGTSNGQTTIEGCHFENPGQPSSYAEYIPILGVSSDSSTQISIIGCEFANSASNHTWTTIIRHGGQFFAAGNHIDNYNGSTITNFVLHDLDNGLATDYVIQTSVQGGALSNIIGGSGGVAYSLASAASAMFNVSNSYSIGLRAQGSNTNEFFSGSTTTATWDHSGNWNFTTGVTTLKNFNTIYDASAFTGADIGAQVNAAYAQGVAAGVKGMIITIPAGTYSYSTPIVFGSNAVRASLRGAPGGGTELDFTGAAGTIAITINTGNQNGTAEHSSYDAINGITFKGNRTSSSTPTVGIYAGGTFGAAGAEFHNVNVEGFGLGVQWGANTYHTNWYGGVVRNCAQLMLFNAASNSGEALHFYGGFFVDPFDATYVTANGIQFADSSAASALFSGCSFDDTQVRIGQANNVTFEACHWENPGSANWGAYTYVSIDNNLATNVSFNGDTFFATGVTSPTAYFSNGGNITMNGVIIRKFTGSTMTNMGSLTGSGRITWTGMNNVSGTAITNVVSGVPYSPSGFANQAGNYYQLDASANATFVRPYVAKTGTYSIALTDYLINCTSGTFTATLPTAVGITGREFIIKNSGAGTITVGTTSAQTIDGSTTVTLDTQYAAIAVVSDGANWAIVG